MNRRKILLLILIFSVISILLNFFVSISIKSNIRQLNSLLHSDYVYSATVRIPTNQDDYYQYDAGINFALSAKENTSLNADVLMQSKNVQYTNSIFWNAKHLNTYDVAISKNIARANNLNPEDKLYSKHIVDSTVHEYTIKQILPDAVNVRVSPQKKDSLGIIIMGHDKRYADNITHSIITFTKLPVEELISKDSYMPENIIYREDEIAVVCKRLLPYIMLSLILSVLITAILLQFLEKDITHNYRRQIMLGFEGVELIKAFKRLFYKVGAFSIMLAFCASVMVIFFLGINYIEILLLLLLLFIELITLFLLTLISNKCLWRS